MKMGKISELQKLNLNSSGSKITREKTIRENSTKEKLDDGIERYISNTPRDQNNKPPILHIVDSQKSTHIAIGLHENSFIWATLENTDTQSKVFGYSTGNLKKSLTNLSSFGFYCEKEFDETKCLMVYGAICEALCRAGISLKFITADIYHLSAFINLSLYYYHMTGPFPDDNEADLPELLNWLEVEKASSLPKNDIFGKFILPNKIILVVTNTQFFINVSESEVYCMERPWTDTHTHYHTETDTAGLWILLASLEFHIKESLSRLNNENDFNIPLSDYEDARLISPSAFREIFLDAHTKKASTEKSEKLKAMLENIIKEL